MPTSDIDSVPSPRIPIWLQLSLATMVVLAVSISVLSYVIMERQRTNLFDHTVKLGSVSLRHVVDNAKVPLLTGDLLALSTLINNVVSVDGHYYAFIVDSDGIIRAHTDQDMLEKPYSPVVHEGETIQLDQATYFTQRLPDGSEVINLSMPIIFQDKQLGEVHVGLSVDFIRQLFIDERAFLVWATVVIIVLGVVAAVMYSRRFTRPLSALVQATTQIARGNYDFKVRSDRNDELGRLGEAFNRMGEELARQALIRESFGKYVGSEVLEQITRSPGELWVKGQRGEASILFADIRGFTAYAEGRDPEEVVERLNEFFAIATEVIFRHGGSIDKFIGDSVLAVFGIPVFHQDHLARSIRAAKDMQQQLAAAVGNGNPLLASVGIGIASGVVVAGNIGSSVKMEYTVIGDCVNVAASLNNLAGPGEIIIGGDGGSTFAEIAEVEALEPQKIKNREQLVQVFRVVKTMCCLVALLPILFGCAGLDDRHAEREPSGPAVFSESRVLLADSAQWEALQAEEQGRYDEAVTYWRQAETVVREKIALLSEKLRQLAGYHAERGAKLFEKKEGERARQAFLEALTYDPDNQLALDYLLHRYRPERFHTYTVAEGDTSATIAEKVYGSRRYEFAVRRLSPGGDAPALTAGREVAVADLDSLYSPVLIDYGRQIRLARQLFADQRFEEVVPVVRTILRDNPNDEEASYIRNRSLLALAEQQRAEERFGEALATLSLVDPNFKNLKPLLAEIGAQRSAKQEHDQIRTNGELFRRGEQLAGQGRHLEALETLQKIDPVDDRAQQLIDTLRSTLKVQAEEHFKEGVRLFVEENLTGAVGEWETTLRLDPNHPHAAQSLATARTLLQRVEEIR